MQNQEPRGTHIGGCWKSGRLNGNPQPATQIQGGVATRQDGSSEARRYCREEVQSVEQAGSGWQEPRGWTEVDATRRQRPFHHGLLSTLLPGDPSSGFLLQYAMPSAPMSRAGASPGCQRPTQSSRSEEAAAEEPAPNFCEHMQGQGRKQASDGSRRGKQEGRRLSLVV